MADPVIKTDEQTNGDPYGVLKALGSGTFEELRGRILKTPAGTGLILPSADSNSIYADVIRDVTGPDGQACKGAILSPLVVQNSSRAGMVTKMPDVLTPTIIVCP
jgi:hypothetical protein